MMVVWSNPRRANCGGRTLTVGERLRKARQGRSLSLQQVAEKTHLSSATLSRIENSKQGLDLEVFLQLARVLDLDPAQLLGEDSGGKTEASIIAQLDSHDRLQMWRDLASETKTKKGSGNMRRAQIRALATELQDVVAQIDFLREQVEYLRRRLRNC